jgi:hypothetical protein
MNLGLGGDKTQPMAQIAFLNIPPRDEGFVGCNNNRAEINEAINKVPGIKTINIDEEITCGWKIRAPNYALDNLHFSRAGFAIIFKHLTRIGTWK